MQEREGITQQGRPRRVWKGNIKIDLNKRVRGGGLDLSGSGQRQKAACCEHGN